MASSRNKSRSSWEKVEVEGQQPHLGGSKKKGEKEEKKKVKEDKHSLESFSIAH